MYRNTHAYIQGSRVEIQTPAPWNLIGRSLTAPLAVLSPSNILPPSSSHCALLAARKNSARFLKLFLFQFLLFVCCKSEIRLSPGVFVCRHSRSSHLQTTCYHAIFYLPHLKYLKFHIFIVLSWFSPRKPGFNLRSANLGFVEDKVKPGRSFLRVLFPVSSILSKLHIHLSIADAI
jgi:hypothetical protein